MKEEKNREINFTFMEIQSIHKNTLRGDCTLNFILKLQDAIRNERGYKKRKM